MAVKPQQATVLNQQLVSFEESPVQRQEARTRAAQEGVVLSCEVVN